MQPPPGQQQQQQQQQQHNQKRASKTQSVIVTTAPQIPGAASPLKGSARIRRKSLIVTGKDQQQQPQQARRHRASSNFHGGLSSAASFSGGPNCANDDDLWEPPPPVVKLFQDEFSVMTALEKARAAMYEPSASVIFTDFISQLEAGAHTATSSTIPAATTPKSTAEKSSQKGSAYNTPIPEAFVTQSNFAPVASVDFFADPVPQNLSINPVPFQTCYGNDTGDDKKKKVTPRGVKDEDEDNSEDGEDEISKTFSKRPGHTQSAIAMSLRSTNNGSSNTTTSNTNAAMAAGSNGNRRGKPGLITSKDEKEEDGNSNTTGGDEDGSKCTLEKPKCIHEVDPETQMAIVQPVVLKSLLTEEIKAYDAVQEKLQKKHKYIVTLPPDYNTKVTIELTEAGTILNAVSEVLRTYKAGPVILKNAPDAYVLYMADDAGLPETDFPAPDVTRRIIDMQCSTFALYENPNCMSFRQVLQCVILIFLFFF